MAWPWLLSVVDACIKTSILDFIQTSLWLAAAIHFAMTSPCVPGSVRAVPVMQRTTREALPVLPLALHIPTWTVASLTAGAAFLGAAAATAALVSRARRPRQVKPEQPKQLGVSLFKQSSSMWATPFWPLEMG